MTRGSPAARAPGERHRATVAIVAPHYPPKIGGVERYAERIAQEIRRSPDLRPIVITSHPGRRTKIEFRDGVEVVQLSSWFTLSNTPINPVWFWSVRRLLRRYQVDVVNTHSPVPFLADVATWAASGRPVVQTYHSGSMVKNTGHLDGLIALYEKHVLSRVFRRAAVLVAVSPTSLAHDVAGARIITPGVDTEKFTPSLHPWGNTLLYVGRIDRTSAWKGVDVLLRAFARLLADVPDARLRLVGSGDAVADQQELARSLHITDHVEFAGELSGPDLVEAYSHARALVLPSLTEAESFGMTLIEAMACARPVIGSAIGGIPYVIGDGCTGLLVPPGDIDALAAGCRRLLADDELCARLGSNGRRVVESRYAWPQLTASYLDIFRSLLHSTYPLSEQGSR
jgi:glycosyltransferase involved in cell wall biosynthesis